MIYNGNMEKMNLLQLEKDMSNFGKLQEKIYHNNLVMSEKNMNNKHPQFGLIQIQGKMGIT